jgi:hypothetical protein
VATRFARHFHLAAIFCAGKQIGALLDRQDFDGLASLLGPLPSDVDSADAELEHFVLSDDGRHDEALV